MRPEGFEMTSYLFDSIRFLEKRPCVGYISAMNIHIDEDAVGKLNLSESQLKFDLAIGLFVDGRVSLGRAARTAGMDTIEFQRELGSRRIPLHYGVKEFQRDLETIQQLSAH